MVQAPVRVRQSETGKAEALPDPWKTGIVQGIPGNILPPETAEKESEVTAGFQAPAGLVQATPNLFHIGTLLDDRLRLRMPIEVVMEQEGDWYIVKCEYAGEFGYGLSPLAAVDDLRLTLSELYWTLEEEQERLSPNLRDVRKRLSELIEKQ